MRILGIAAGVLIAIGFASQAHAVPIVLTLDTSGAVSVQQTANRPCVIGDPSCANPTDFPSTTLSANDSVYTNIGSPIYSVAQIRALVGNTFRIGIDVNS